MSWSLFRISISTLILRLHTGKYVGNRPIKLKKAEQAAVRPVEIGHRKARKLESDLKKNRKKPY